eukprot:SAG31_NODE_37689_length_302_cov_0.763547_1_plen_100_part_11
MASSIKGMPASAPKGFNYYTPPSKAPVQVKDAAALTKCAGKLSAKSKPSMPYWLNRCLLVSCLWNRVLHSFSYLTYALPIGSDDQPYQSRQNVGTNHLCS